RRVGIGTQITPFTNNRVPDKTVMSFIGGSNNNHVIYLTSHFGMGPNRSFTIYFSSQIKFRTFAQCNWTSQVTAFHHFSIFPDIDFSRTAVNGGELKGSSF